MARPSIFPSCPLLGLFFLVTGSSEDIKWACDTKENNALKANILATSNISLKRL